MSQEAECRQRAAAVSELIRRLEQKNAIFKAIGDRLKLDESKAPDDGGMKERCLELAREGFKA